MLSSFSPLPRNMPLMTLRMPPMSAIIEPIMPPGSPQPSNNEDMCLLAGLMK